MQTWTPEPWSACRGGECSCGMIWGGDSHIASVISGDWGDTFPAIRLSGEHVPGSCTGELSLKASIEMVVYGTIPPEQAKANAARIVACVNAMLGIDDPEAFRQKHDPTPTLPQSQECEPKRESDK